MANLKEFRNKIGVIQSTRKVTSAMKLVAGVKLKKAEQTANSSREYAFELENVFSKLRREFLNTDCEFFSGRKVVNAEMLIVIAADRGLCGNFNYLIGKEVEQIIAKLHEQNVKACIICIGYKLFEMLKPLLSAEDSIELASDFYKSDNLFSNSKKIAEKAIDYFEAKKVDKISIVYTKSYTVIKHNVETKTIIPVQSKPNTDKTVTILEPNAKQILKTALPYNIGIQIYQSVLESIVGEQGSRMTSMDNATRNADELLSNLTLKYNRTRQYNITQELAEVVSGAEAISKG
ncbi:MAG: ATP synthase F1 subunit gamma [Holosporaceae bacterium]|jgi:F-type H+-transporting ATPase subunit gamma|nr:ATP synthase F1 subunit gamma [Holosporaceae bacterium]